MEPNDKLDKSDKPTKKDNATPKMDLITTQPGYFDQKRETKLIRCRERANDIKARLKDYTKQQTEHSKSIIKSCTSRLKREWPSLFGATPKTFYVHVDLDAFYANCEILRQPEYKTIPVGIGNNLMLCTSNYEARKYGVKAGMPGYMARRLCPDLVIIKPDFPRYNFYSEMVMSVLVQFDKQVEIYGMDEVGLTFNEDKLKKAYETWNTNKTVGRGVKDNEESVNNIEYNKYSDIFEFESVQWIVNKIRGVVFRNTGLTISAGISVCLAKFASDVNKPDGQCVIKEKFEEYLQDLKADKLNGIRRYTKEMLEKTLNIKTVRELRENNHILYLILGRKSFENLFRLSFGLSCFDRPKIIERLNITKSKARDVTFRATKYLPDLLNTLWEASGELEHNLERSLLSHLELDVKILRVLQDNENL